MNTTDSAKAMSVVVGLRIVIAILLGPIAGVIADRVDRRKLMWTMDFLRAGLVLIMAKLLSAEGLPFYAILPLTAIVAMATTLQNPAFSASLVNIVGKENITEANSSLVVALRTAMIGGPIAAGTIVALFGGASAMVVDALTFLLAGLCVVLGGSFPSPKRNMADRKPFWQDVLGGLSYIRESRIISALTILWPCVNFFGNMYVIMLPVLAVRTWQTSPSEYGWIQAMFPIGIVGGAMLLGSYAKRLKRRGLIISTAISVLGPVIAVIGLMPNARYALPVIVVLGFFFSLSNTLMASTVQEKVQPEFQGRVFGVLTSLGNVATPLAMAASGVAADLIGPIPVVVTAGICLGVVGVSSLGLKALRIYN